MPEAVRTASSAASQPAASPPGEATALALVRDLKSAYLDGRPILIDPASDTQLTPELLLNPELALGPFDDPAVLTLVAHLDPQVETALAALARLVRVQPSRRQAAAMLDLIAAKSPHRPVRGAAALLKAQRFSPRALAELEALAQQETEASRTRALAQIANALRVLAAGEAVAASFAENTLAAMRRAGLSPPVVGEILTTWMTSPTASRSAKVALAQYAAKLPFDWRLQLATAVNALPRDETTAGLRRILARAIEGAPPETDEGAKPAARMLATPQPWAGSLRRVSSRQAGSGGA
jgi:hypothetical protein